MRTKASNLAPPRHCPTRSLIEQSQRGGLKQADASTAGIIPGDRGKAGGSWCRPPLLPRKRSMAGIYHQFLWPESCPVSQTRTRNCAASRDQKPRASRVRPTGSFDPCADAVTPEGYSCYCGDQNAVAKPGGTTPPEGPARSTNGARKGIATAGSSSGPRQSPPNSSLGRREKHVTPLQTEKQPER